MEKIRNMSWGLIGASLFFMVGLVGAGFFIGQGFMNSKVSKTVTVKGLAEKEVMADFAFWDINVQRVGNDLIEIQGKIDADLQNIKQFLISKGFDENEIQLQRIKVRDKYSGYSDMDFKVVEAENMKTGKKIERYVIDTGITVRSNKVLLVDEISRQTGELVKKGITITEDYRGPSYIFNGLNKIKTGMVEEATKNARTVADQFAKDSSSNLGDIKTATQGVFSIEARDKIDEWNPQESQSIYKNVRVVTTITYYLK